VSVFFCPAPTAPLVFPQRTVTGGRGGARYSMRFGLQHRYVSCWCCMNASSMNRPLS